MPWNPEQYHKFQAERAAPFEDLTGLVTVREGMRVIDLGCGTGELTARLAERLPGSDVLGIDSSAEMLKRAAECARPGLRFEQRTIEEVAADPAMAGAWDLVFTHAALQWLDDHEGLIPKLLSMVKPGGQLAVQMPSNYTHRTHRLILELAREEPFLTALDGWVRLPTVLTIDRYAEMLFAQRGEKIAVFEKIYPHMLENADGLAEWTKGTALVPYLERLGETLRDQFMEAYRARLRTDFPQAPVFYPFRRILFAATRSAGS